ncbi:MAG: PadR family transcriptional regulator [Actinomycetota bacterium]
MAPRMTTSSYAILALLSLRPWTAYELTQQAARSLRYAWPKSERHLYSEPKKLVELGHATTHKEQVGKRTRNVYEITDQGRVALTEWTSIPTAPPQLEAEALLRLLFAEHGTLEDLNTAFDEFETDTRELRQSVVDLMAGYLEGEHPFPERTHLSVLFATFQLEMFTLIENWIEFARGETADWPTTKDLGMNERTELITRIIASGESVLDNPLLEKPDGH